MLDVADAAQLHHPSSSSSKRLFDIAVASLAVLLLLPFLCLLALAIRMETPGPAVFRQRRTGLNGRIFTIYKLRTMTVAEDGPYVRQATRGDCRVTQLGAALRKLSLDELPQLLNVLKGDMSIVGPRPHALSHDNYYGARVADYAHRFRARPGLTGYAQVNGLRGELQGLQCMSDRVAADRAWLHPGVVLRPRHAHRRQDISAAPGEIQLEPIDSPGRSRDSRIACSPALECSL